MSGPFCTGGCLEYPYTTITSRFPRDYLWMYPAMLLTCVYVVWIICIGSAAPIGKRIYGRLGMAFAVMAANTLVMDYFVQVSVIQPSLLHGETEGIALLSQYNPHGLFIVLEELGYLFMSLSFLFTSFVYAREKGLENTVRITFRVGFILAVVALAWTSFLYGVNREYIFEIVVISINWLVLLITGIVQARIFHKALQKNIS